MTVLPNTALPTAGWATARGARRVAADAAAVRTSPTAFAAAVADGIGDTGAAASAARFAVAEAVDAAWRAGVLEAAGVSEAMEDVRRGLHESGLSTHPLDVPLPRPAGESLPQPPAPDVRRAHATGSGDTTLVVAAGGVPQWFVAWVGDCRAYFLPENGPATLLTTDHTVGRYLRDRGVDANPRLDLVVTTTARKGGHGVARGAGPGRLVLLTNGVHRATDEATVTRLARSATDPAEAARALVDVAVEDNAAAVVVDLR
ncbi:protein phosphatase 2C domain-containing protein [Saccharothrix sp.]|uniref:PP2C family protein-serine/threonine phosphatase n=1 Tax=Saccharothrix sp. TaxID=1873460 RepID=UPI0028122DAA|nr:protein phosphatase 2C domain-containing protein [Saccharothrix sp.]